MNHGKEMSYSQHRLKIIFENYRDLYDVKWRDQEFSKIIKEKASQKLIAPHNIRFFIQRTKDLSNLEEILKQLEVSCEIVQELSKEMKRYKPYGQIFLLLIPRLEVRNKNAIKEFYTKAIKSFREEFNIRIPLKPWEVCMDKFDSIIELYQPITSEYIRYGHPSYTEALHHALEDHKASNDLYQVDSFLSNLLKGKFNDQDFSKIPDLQLEYEKGPLIELEEFFEEPFLTITPFVIKLDNGKYRMFYTNVKRNKYTKILKGYIASALSDDGLNWKKEEGKRINNDTQLDSKYSFAPNIIKVKKNQYRMYYVGSDGGKYRILSAVSEDTLDWQKEEGIRKNFDNFNVSVSTPHVIKKFDNHYIMFYCGFDKFTYQIFKSESSDGLNWTEDTLIIPYGSELDFLGVQDPTFLEYPEGFYRIFYTGADGNSDYRVLSAMSTDLNLWKKEKGIRFSYKKDEKTQGVHLTSLVKIKEGKYRFYFQLYYQNTYSIHSGILNF